jgi:hypothetical protein
MDPVVFRLIGSGPGFGIRLLRLSSPPDNVINLRKPEQTTDVYFHHRGHREHRDKIF